MSAGMPLNWRSGVCEPHVRRAAILHSARALSASAAHPRLSTISKMHRKMRPALCVTYTMSAISANPSSFIPLMYACSRMLIFAVGSSMLSLTGIGTRSASFASSSFSSSRTEMYLNSSASENSRHSSMSPMDGFKCSLNACTVPCEM